MLDFTASLAPEMVWAFTSDRRREAGKGALARQLRELDRVNQEPKNIRRLVLGRKNAAHRRRALFVEGLDAAQREGITIDAWFGYRFADPELSARAEWAGLVEDGARNKKDAWAA
jgi:hypothetical protein